MHWNYVKYFAYDMIPISSCCITTCKLVLGNIGTSTYACVLVFLIELPSLSFRVS